MNCVTFRRILQTDPTSQDAEFQRHKCECVMCAPAVQRATHFERALHESLRIEIPEGLESRILLRQAFSRKTRRPRPRLPYALAASVLFAVLVWVGARGQVAHLDSIEYEVVSLAQSSNYALSATEPVGGAQVSQALGVVGLGLDSPLEAITFASHCTVRGRLAGHLVLRGSDWGPVTVFLIPKSIVTKRKAFRESGWSGVLVPTPVGTIAVLGAGEEAVASVESRMLRVLRLQQS